MKRFYRVILLVITNLICFIMGYFMLLDLTLPRVIFFTCGCCLLGIIIERVLKYIDEKQ